MDARRARCPRIWWADEREEVVAPGGLMAGAMLTWWPHSMLMSEPSARYTHETKQPRASGRSGASPTLNIVI
jgi:hypothetical protein